MGRIEDLEEIIRSKNRLIKAMYTSDSEVDWPNESDKLQSEYEDKYGISLSQED